jgi:hypothetical protein
MDDDVMDQQKYASAAMVLAKALVDIEKEAAAGEFDEEVSLPAASEDRVSTLGFDSYGNHSLATLPLHKARETMTRADFIKSYDHDNIFTISSDGMVRADSVPMMRAFRAVCAEPGFDDFLEKTLERIGDIESLGRTREITLKDLWKGGKYKLSMAGKNSNVEKVIEMATLEGKDDEKEN